MTLAQVFLQAAATLAGRRTFYATCFSLQNLELKPSVVLSDANSLMTCKEELQSGLVSVLCFLKWDLARLIAREALHLFLLTPSGPSR